MKKPKKSLQLFQIVLSSALFFGFMFMQVRYSDYLGVLQGVVAQAQVMISIYMVMFIRPWGFASALVVNGINVLQISYYMINNNDLRPLPGIIIPMTTVLIVSLLSYYIRNLNREIAESQRQQTILEQTAEKLNRLAYFDPLTGFLNRESVIENLELLCRAAREENQAFALVFIDMDGFKNINDTMGHTAGDELLRAISARFASQMQPNDLIGRIGGDEFALLIRRDLDDVQILSLVARLQQSVRRIDLQGYRTLEMSCCCGVALSPRDSVDGMELLRYADTAMYKAKAMGKGNTRFFTHAIKEELQKRVEMERLLLGAVANGEFSLVFQPQFFVRDHRIRGYEALARWNSPVLGQVPPGLFIPVAEDSGAILALGDSILEQACLQFVSVQPTLPEGCRLSVNLSAKQIFESDFLEKVQDVLRRTGLAAGCLELEITESVFISEVDAAVRVMNRLRDCGIHLALDDFGVGYSSLYLLEQMPIDTLKIDKAFIQNLGQGERVRQVAVAIIQMVHQMGIEVVAEGVEDEAQLAFLREHDCDCLQGYLWGRPGPLAATTS